jgi:ATP-dependent RNA helicase SUPV3L1/SUV3
VSAVAEPSAAPDERPQHRRHERHSDRSERSDRPRSPRPDQQQRADRQDRGDRGGRPPRGDRPDRAARGDRPERDPDLRAKYIKGRGEGRDRRDREADPNSPFAKLAALKEQLEANAKEPH